MNNNKEESDNFIWWFFIIIIILSLFSCDKNDCKIYECDTNMGKIEVNTINMDYYDEKYCHCKERFK